MSSLDTLRSHDSGQCNKISDITTHFHLLHSLQSIHRSSMSSATVP